MQFPCKSITGKDARYLALAKSTHRNRKLIIQFCRTAAGYNGLLRSNMENERETVVSRGHLSLCVMNMHCGITFEYSVRPKGRVFPNDKAHVK